MSEKTRKKIGKRSRQKGGQFEIDTLKQICRALGLEYGRDLRRKYSREKGCDVVWLSPKGMQKFPFSFEAKNRATLSVYKWWDKLVKEDLVEGTTPLLVFHRQGTSEDFVVLNLDKFLEILKCQNL